MNFGARYSCNLEILGVLKVTLFLNQKCYSTPNSYGPEKFEAFLVKFPVKMLRKSKLNILAYIAACF